MKSALLDVFVHRSDNSKLVELYEESAQVEQYLRMPYYHFVFFETNDGVCFIHTEGAEEPIKPPQRSFQARLEELDKPTVEELCFLIAIYILDRRIQEIKVPIPNPVINVETIPECILQLVRQTMGYLIYREQGEAFYQLATGCSISEAKDWVAKARMKNRSVLDGIYDLKIDGMTVTYLDKLFPKNGGLPYLLRKPVYEAKMLFESLQ